MWNKKKRDESLTPFYFYLYYYFFPASGQRAPVGSDGRPEMGLVKYEIARLQARYNLQRLRCEVAVKVAMEIDRSGA
jgi:hypothetical protein